MNNGLYSLITLEDRKALTIPIARPGFAGKYFWDFMGKGDWLGAEAKAEIRSFEVKAIAPTYTFSADVPDGNQFIIGVVGADKVISYGNVGLAGIEEADRVAGVKFERGGAAAGQPAGTTRFVQVGNVSATTTLPNGTKATLATVDRDGDPETLEYFLDSSVPYPDSTPTKMQDSPLEALSVPNSSLVAVDRFFTFLEWKSEREGSEWVPIQVLNWAVVFKAKMGADGIVADDGSYSTVQEGQTSTPATMFPEWKPGKIIGVDAKDGTIKENSLRTSS